MSFQGASEGGPKEAHDMQAHRRAPARQGFAAHRSLRTSDDQGLIVSRQALHSPEVDHTRTGRSDRTEVANQDPVGTGFYEGLEGSVQPNKVSGLHIYEEDAELNPVAVALEDDGHTVAACVATDIVGNENPACGLAHLRMIGRYRSSSPIAKARNIRAWTSIARRHVIR